MYWLKSCFPLTECSIYSESPKHFVYNDFIKEKANNDRVWKIQKNNNKVWCSNNFTDGEVLDKLIIIIWPLMVVNITYQFVHNWITSMKQLIFIISSIIYFVWYKNIFISLYRQLQNDRTARVWSSHLWTRQRPMARPRGGNWKSVCSYDILYFA